MWDFRRYFDVPTMIVIVMTLILFVAALFTTGFTHDLLLEAGVFLVSVKLILMAYHNKVAYREIGEKIDRICECVLKETDNGKK
jgi:hypothetical protein